MNPEVWHQADILFQAAVELDTADRPAFLDEGCAGDQILRREVESLLSSDSREWEFIERSALESAAVLLADEQPRLAPGQEFGHYEILKLIGRGGMGEVYLARDRILNRNIALKLLPSDYTQNPDRLRRFQREAQTVSALNHPNIITIHELGSVSDQQYIATELIEGETLRGHIARGPLAVSDAVDIAIQTAGALAAAHRAGIVHRDIKPENIMLRPDGYVKVLDFGLAKLAEQPELDPHLTAAVDAAVSSGLVMGTLRYMSPEQASGLTVDARSDIFSLGVVLYEMIAGLLPFDHNNHQDLIESILKDDPPALGSFVSEVPDTLALVITKMLTKDRTCRYQNADELIFDLRLLKEGLGSGSKPAQEGQRQTSRNVISVFTSKLDRLGRVGSSVAFLLVVVLASAIGYTSYRFIRSAATGATPSSSLSETGTWAIKAPISSPRWQAEPAVLDDALYAVGGWNVCSAFANLERYDPGTDTWTQRAPMPTARGGHGVGVLEGKLYAVGGTIDCGVHTASVEAYDPASDSWSAKTPLPNVRFGHVVAVANGKLHAIGGSSTGSDYLSLNSQYDPESDTWTEKAPMPTARLAAAVAVVDGIIYVIGGGGYAGTLATVEAYDPIADTWTARRSTLMSRVSFAASEAGGIIYAFGGRGNRMQVEAYDPAADAWAIVAHMPTASTHFHAATLRDSIYLVGGSDGINYSSSVLAFTPKPNAGSEAVLCPTLQTTSRTTMPTKRSNMTVGAIDGIIYVVGGYEFSGYLAVNEAYDPLADTWTTKAPLPAPRETRGSNNAVLDGKLYMIGGNASGKCSSLNEVYDPATDRWMTKAPMPTPRCHLAVVELSGLIYALGGTNTNGLVEYNTVEVYDPRTDTWGTVTPMPTARQDVGAVSLNGILYAIGGGNPALNPGDSELNIVEAYDPVSNKWTTLPPMPTTRSAMAVGVLNGMIVVVGGVTNEKAASTVDGYDPKVGAWTNLMTVQASRSYSSAVTINNVMYAFGGNATPEANSSVTANDAISLKPCSNQK